jgi:hypothetical protein
VSLLGDTKHLRRPKTDKARTAASAREKEMINVSNNKDYLTVEEFANAKAAGVV